MSKEIMLTVGITAHSEGFLAHKTMRAVFAGLKKLDAKKYPYEIIVHIDNGTKATIEYFDRYKNEKNFRVFQNSFGDTGPSRNFIIKQAKGKYVSFLDGDDLISENWYESAIQKLEKSKEEIVVHPEAILTFGLYQPNVLTIQEDSLNTEKDIAILVGENRWCSVLMAKKETLLKIPYRTLGSGYGHEDYVFNLDVIKANITHRIVKKTVLFYRRSDSSRLSSGNQEHVIIPYIDAFSFDKVKQFTYGLHKEHDLKKSGYKLYKKIRSNNTLNFFITPVAKLTLKVIKHGKKITKIPEWIIDEWANMNSIDTLLWPYDYVMDGVTKYSAEEYINIGKTYIKVAKSVTQLPDYVFIVPWVVRGGADKVLFNYIKALKEIHPDWHFAVITTLPANNSWANRLPDYVDFIDFGNISDGLVPPERDTLFSRVITQLRCKNLHIINSEFGYLWAREHKTLLKAKYCLNVSLFSPEFIPGTDGKGVFSYSNPYLFEIFPVVNRVFTDNATMIQRTMDENGFSDEKFKVHYQPAEDMKITPPKSELIEKRKIKILWASRVTPTKLPELVEQIGKHLNSSKFEIDVYGEKAKGVSKSLFVGVSNVHYKGTYDGFYSIPTTNYDMLLYTARDDGVPNILLEATAAGLPIIASNDGGVGEFVQNNKTGILIKDFLKPEPYVEALNKTLESPDSLPIYVKNAQKLLRERHSWEKFVEIVKKDIG